jgi:hypothetical protein
MIMKEENPRFLKKARRGQRGLGNGAATARI